MHSTILLLQRYNNSSTLILENPEKVVFLYPMNKIDISPFFKAINQGGAPFKTYTGRLPPKGYLFQASGL